VKILLVVALTLLPVVAAQADFDDPNVMGMFFSDTEFSDSTNGIDTPGAPFNAYIVVLNPEVETIGGYEVAISITDPTVFIMSTLTLNKWVIADHMRNQIVRFSTPVPVVDSVAILCTMQMLYSGTDHVDILFGPADPLSIPGHNGPVLVDGANLNTQEILIPCGTPYHESLGGWVASFNSPGILPVKTGSFSNLKAMFR